MSCRTVNKDQSAHDRVRSVNNSAAAVRQGVSVTIDVQLLQCFVAVSDERHFRRAGERLGYSTSYVSQRIRRLEREFGVHLFVRTSRSVHPTAAALELTPKVRAVLE